MSPADPTARRSALLASIESAGITSVLVVDPCDIHYLTGYRTNLYSRPISLLVGPGGTVLMVPAIEAEQARGTAKVDDVRTYHEVPGEHVTDYGLLLAEALSGGRAGPVVGVDHATCAIATLGAITRAGLATVDIGPHIKSLRLRKDSAEIARIRQAAALVSVAVVASLAAIRVGISELELDGVGDQALRSAAAAEHPAATLESFAMTPSGVERTLLPHTGTSGRRLREGDVLIHTRQVVLSGYRSEYEQTAVVGSASAEQRRALATVTEAQRQAVDAVAPGRTGAEIDRVARDVLVEGGYGKHVIHRTGHGVGLSFHEGPSLDFTNDQPLEPGMVVTIEPGCYVPGLGGFRHSHTVLVTDGGSEVLTGIGDR